MYCLTNYPTQDQLQIVFMLVLQADRMSSPIPYNKQLPGAEQLSEAKYGVSYPIGITTEQGFLLQVDDD